MTEENVSQDFRFKKIDDKEFNVAKNLKHHK